MRSAELSVSAVRLPQTMARGARTRRRRRSACVPSTNYRSEGCADCTRRLGTVRSGRHSCEPGKIQEESLYYEHKKHDGSYPIVGVNTFLAKHSDGVPKKIELARSTEEEKQSQLKRLAEFHARNAKAAPAALERLKRVVIENGNVFAELMKTVRVCSLGQITKTLFEVGGEYRRSM